MHRMTCVIVMLITIAGCASAPSSLPYPAFIAVDDLPDAFVAGLPGVRAKQLSIDPRTQRASYRIAIPADWSFTTGASPGHSVEIFVLAGQLQIGEFAMTAGGYVYLPPGMPGVPISSRGGALMLYFVDEASDAAVIRSPLITSSDLIEWQARDAGVSVGELRADPGSGARTWLMRLSPEAMLKWRRSSQIVEGYLLNGAVTWSECTNEDAVTAEYRPGGYFHRPPGAVNGGPESRTATGATWLLRVPGKEQIEIVAGCL